MENFINEAKVAKRIALDAGKLLLEYYDRDLTVNLKPGDEPVTIADQAISEFILKELAKEFPQDLLVSEESPDSAERLKSERFWLIDPLDGTKEFLARNGEFSVMIGLVVKKQAVAGTVYQPTENRLWWGTCQESYLNHSGQEKNLKVSDINNFAEMRTVVSRSHRGGKLADILKHFGITQEIISGSGGIKLGLISSADAELMFSPSPGYKLWDLCAPDAILSGAGGKVTDFTGSPIDYTAKEVNIYNGILASNNTRHSEIANDLVKLVSLPFKFEKKH